MRAPEIPAELVCLNRQEKLELAEMRGRFVLLEFMQADDVHGSVEPCDIGAVLSPFPTEVVHAGVLVPRFDADRDRDLAHDHVTRLDLHHPVVHDPDATLAAMYGVEVYPTIAIVDPAGHYLGSVAGTFDRGALTRFLARHVAEHEAAGTLERRPRRVERRPDAPTVLRYPTYVALDGDHAWVADTGHHQVVELALDDDRRCARIVRRFGRGEPKLADGAGRHAAFASPRGLCHTGDALIVSDAGNHCLRRIDLENGRVATLAGTGERGTRPIEHCSQAETSALQFPLAACSHAGGIMIAMGGTRQLWSLGPGARIEHVAGTGEPGSHDGPADEATFVLPTDLAAGEWLYVADSEANAIRAVSLEFVPTVWTLVGGRGHGDSDGRGDEARLQHPSGLALVGSVLWLSDSYNHKIKTLDPLTLEAATQIGTGRAGDRDGGFGSARLREPEGIAHDGRRLLIADRGNHAIRVADLEARCVWTLEVG